MYRKYSGSNKTSRNERLAQLTEQESVIERKKREILAKIEAQKKKETEDALKRLEPSNILKKDDFPNSEKDSYKSEETLRKEAKVQFPKNAFSNDGSFLDHFKKLSSTSLDPKSDSSLFSAAPAKKENFCKKQDDYEKGKPEILSRENSQKGSLEFPAKEVPVNIAADNIGDNKFPFTNFSSNSYSKLLTHSLPPQLSSMTKIRNNEETHVTQNPSHSFCKDSADKVREKFINFKNKWENQGSTYENSVINANQPQYNITMPLSKTNYLEMDKSERISPALTNFEEDCSQASENYHSSDTVAQHGEETKNSLKRAAIDEINRFSSGKGADHRSQSPSLNLQTAGAYSTTDPTQSNKTFSFDEERLHRKDSSDSDTNSRESFQSYRTYQPEKDQKLSNSDGYQADCEEGSSCSKIPRMGQKKLSFHKTLTEDSSSSKEEADEGKDNEKPGAGDVLSPEERRKRRKKSRWGDEVASSNAGVQLPSTVHTLPLASGPASKTTLLSKLTRSDPGLIQYAKQTFGSTNLSEEDWKKAEDHYKINLLYQDMVKKRAEIDRLEKAGKFKYEYDSDEDVEGGTWEHKLRQQEMMATQLWAEELTRQAAGKHHIGDFLPPEELERFMERYNAVKQGRKPDLSDYKEFKLKEDNVGYRLLQKMGWNEGQGLGQDGSGITNPVNKASTRHENQGLGVVRPDGLEAGDDEYDAYRKRMMLAYRFRPNPLNNPRRPYY